MFKILQITDLHIMADAHASLYDINTDASFQAVLAAAHQNHGPFDLIVVSGDLTETPTIAGYQRIHSVLAWYQTMTLCLPGNHDDLALMQSLLNDALISCRKHLVLKDWQIICLHSQKPDTPIGELAAAELEFLENCLSSQPDLPCLIFVHHPCMSVGSAWLDGMQIVNSADFLSVIKDFRQVKAISCGHVHQELIIQLEHLAIFATPATCYQFAEKSAHFGISDAAPGYRIFELYAGGSFASACYRVQSIATNSP